MDRGSMRTTATNKKIRVLLRAMTDGSLVPDPSFQRRLVWSNRHKMSFLDTVLRGLPFPEIYIAAGDVDPKTAAGVELVVDGQQRLTTIRQYFEGSEELRYSEGVISYSALSEQAQREFLEYEVVVRDLGAVPLDEVKEVFRRINSTRYSLNAMEIHNARFEGAFKVFGENIAQHAFFEDNRVFKSTEVRRMADVRFALVFVATIMSTYFDRDDELELYLEKYNDDFPQAPKILEEIERTFGFIWACELPRESRAWKKADLFTLLIEVHRAVVKDGVKLSPADTGAALTMFYASVDDTSLQSAEEAITEYLYASIQATNDRSSRIRRGKVVTDVLRRAAGERPLPFGTKG
jgi:Protein of unknown function DUF262